MVITCPCTLGIAIPLAKVAFIRRAHEQGIIIQDPGVLEQAASLDTMVLDKTGTITEGIFSLRKTVTEGLTESEALSLAASVEAHSTHFAAREIVRQARAAGLMSEEAADFRELPGLGVKGTVNDREVIIGNRNLMEAHGASFSTSLGEAAQHYEQQGQTVIFLGGDHTVLGLFVLGDSLKPSTVEAVKKLQARGIELWLVSGDSPDTTRAVAEQAGIARFQGQALPQHKGEIIKSLQQQGQRVAMVGDGINDAAALAQADVGIALLTGTNFALGSADIHLLSSDPKRVLEVIDLSSLALKAIRQNLFLAFIYNGLAIPLAMSGLINPLIAVTAMLCSSLTVIGNTLRIVRLQ